MHGRPKCEIIFAWALSQREAATVLNMGSGAAVCNQLKTLPERLKDKAFRAAFQKADETLKELRKTVARKP